MKKVLLILSLLLMSIGCLELEQSKFKSISTEIDMLLDSWMINGSSTIRASQDTLFVKIDYSDSDSTRMFYQDSKTNLLIFEMLCYKLNPVFSDYNQVIFDANFSNNDLVFIVQHDISSLNHIKTNFSHRHYEFVEHAFKSLGYINYTSLDVLVIYLHRNLDIFTFKGGFWELLEDLSYSCEVKEPDNSILFNFIIFAGSIKIPEQPLANDAEQLEAIMFYFEKCYIDKKVLNMDAVGIRNYLKYEYTGKAIRVL